MEARIPILCIADGRSVRLFGDRSRLSIHVVEVPSLQSVEGELLVEKFIDETVPWKYRELNFPGRLLATIVPRALRPSEMVTEHSDRELLAAIKRMVAECKPKQSEAVV